MTSFPSALVAAAQFERDVRADSYPRAVQRRRIDPETATLDYQAWCAVADWLEHGRSAAIGCWGGVADPPVTAIDWNLMAGATQRAVARLTDLVDDERAYAALPAGDRDPDRAVLLDDDLAALALRRDRVICIDQAVTRQAQLLDGLNRALRATIGAKAAA